MTDLAFPCTPAKPGTEKQRPRFSIVCVKSIVQGAAVVVKGYTSYFQIKQKSGAFGRDSFTPITPPRKGRSCQTSKKRNDTLLGGTAFFTHYWTTECYLNLFLYMSELICLSSHHRFISIVDKIISPPPPTHGLQSTVCFKLNGCIFITACTVQIIPSKDFW